MEKISLTVKINYISKSAIDLSVNIKDIFLSYKYQATACYFPNK